MTRTRRYVSPLPTATAVVVAVLLAVASTLADAGVGSVGQQSPPHGRMPSSLVLPSRALATALASVAERLEEDWNAGRRPTSPRVHHLSGSGWRWSWSRLNGLRADTLGPIAALLPGGSQLRSPMHGGAWRRDHDADEIPTRDARRTALRRVQNLPPPAIA